MAQTIASHNYVVVKDDIVISLFKGSDLPEYNENDITVIDITGVTPTPDLNWTYNSSTKKFSEPESIPVQVLSELQALKNERNEALISDFKFLGHTFQASGQTYVTIASYASLAALTGKLPEGFFWLDKNNVQVPMTLDEFKQFCTLVFNRVFTIYKDYAENINTLQ